MPPVDGRSTHPIPKLPSKEGRTSGKMFYCSYAVSSTRLVQISKEFPMAEDRRITTPQDQKSLMIAKADRVYQMAVDQNDPATALEALKILMELSK